MAGGRDRGKAPLPSLPAGDAVAWHSAIAQRFDAGYGQSAAFKERLTIWTGLIERFSHPQARVLDAGCGSGIFTIAAGRVARDVVGFDGSAEMIAIAEDRKRQSGLVNITLKVGRLGDPTLTQGEPFDLILCSSVLEYVPDYWRAFDELLAVLKPGGVFCFSMPNGRSLYRRAERVAFQATGRPAYYAHVVNVPQPSDVQDRLRERKLEVLATQFYGAAPLLSGVARRLGRQDLADNLFVIACQRQA
jgi:2-polyprenyl-3-methyl-5-hydroxy-6-metoxy-1,4-benzoquinol methylase